MKKIIQVHISKGDEYFVAECVDLPVVTQGKTLDELAENLKEAIALELSV
jgi:predicted RNase H-like HicB family nuclease